MKTTLKKPFIGRSLCFVTGVRSGKKLEELKEKYQKSYKKLRQTHNEYVLLLSEAQEFERDYRTVIFPGTYLTQLRNRDLNYFLNVLSLKKSNKPVISSENEIEKWHLRQSAKTVPLFIEVAGSSRSLS